MLSYISCLYSCFTQDIIVYLFFCLWFVLSLSKAGKCYKRVLCAPTDTAASKKSNKSGLIWQGWLHFHEQHYLFSTKGFFCLMLRTNRSFLTHQITTISYSSDSGEGICNLYSTNGSSTVSLMLTPYMNPVAKILVLILMSQWVNYYNEWTKKGVINIT